MTNLAALKENLRSKKLKATPARLELLQLLSKSPAPLSIGDMQKKMVKSKPDQATFYRMVKDLKEAGIIRQVNIEHNHAHYEIGNDHHHHAICEQCGKVIDLSSCNIAGLEKEIMKKTKFKTINRHSLEFFGVCNTCSKK
jgi:Fe2+ or Zn2+ uptake regulation protein